MHIASDGSFFLTIEETNEQRIKLGLKPLKVGNDTKNTVIVDQKEDEASEIQKRIELAKIKRKEREFKRKQGIDSDDENQEAKEKLKKEQKKKILAFEEEEEELHRPNAKVYDLSSSKPAIASDFEALKKKKVKNIRVKEKTSQIGVTDDLLQLMEMNSSIDEIHLAKRSENRLTKREEKNLLEEKEKDRTYQEAIDKAQEESMVLHGSDKMLVDEDNLNISGKIFDSTKHFVKTLAVENVKTEPQDATINKRKRKNVSVRSKDEENNVNMDVDADNTNSEILDVKQEIKEEEDVKKDIIQPENLVKEPLVSDGLLATIEFASLQGFLEDKRVGRSKDRSHIEERLKPTALGYDDEADFVIEHLDRHGNSLTPKEAYREFSHKYHENSGTKSS
ncbi:predicted protein [Naegleria gruberi]|uniref:Predicted protein n=1 Tax=Naegleria gruberi TaxID=5762 RepID=D2V9V4_NAEGR|nr:uncharacterized protein NAEGRDRAFT_57568 [Naegleria gruberi]EFC46312.1 predicted protein [Naegleria gruberi]|eukprot:XP_002679056.1 predicted protein [Naegleria gruberi strain NEG-M]